MKNIVIIGGTKGIGKAIVSEVVDNNNVVCLSRNQTDFSHDNYTFHNFDALVDDYPDFESVDCLIYCPGSINLKPISTLSLDDFRNDFELNVIGAVRAIKKYLNLLKPYSFSIGSVMRLIESVLNFLIKDIVLATLS